MTNTPFHPTGKLEVRVSVCQRFEQNRAEKVSNGDLGCPVQQPQHLFVARRANPPGNTRRWFQHRVRKSQTSSSPRARSRRLAQAVGLCQGIIEQGQVRRRSCRVAQIPEQVVNIGTQVFFYKVSYSWSSLRARSMMALAARRSLGVLKVSTWRCSSSRSSRSRFCRRSSRKYAG
jgi:hypothetical protein